MASLTLKNVPDTLMDRLREVADRNHRSLNRQVIEILESATRPRRRDVERILGRAREVRRGFGGAPLADSEILDAIREGRR